MKKKVIVNYVGDVGASLMLEGESDMDILEYVFAMFNHGSGFEAKEFLELKTRSMSVNDTVRVGDQWYQCTSCGWNEISNDRVEELERRVVDHPSFDEHGPWFALSEVMWEDRKPQVV